MMNDDLVSWARAFDGRVLNRRYRLERLMGAGGMGAVFEATHLAVGRRVAIKLLVPHLADNASAVLRFHQEARAAAATSRRGVVDVLDFDRDEACGPYLVMEYLRGQS